MKTSELQGAQLDYWVAKAEGKIAEIIHGHCVRPMARYHDEIQYEMYKPSTDWAQGGPLVAKRDIYLQGASNNWLAHVGGCGAVMRAATPLEAICRAVVAAEFGVEVPDA